MCVWVCECICVEISNFRSLPYTCPLIFEFSFLTLDLQVGGHVTSMDRSVYYIVVLFLLLYKNNFKSSLTRYIIYVLIFYGIINLIS